MRTIEMSAKDMAPRVARYKELKPLAVHDMTDIDFPPSVAEKVAAVHRPALDAFKKAGFTFTAGTDATE